MIKAYAQRLNNFIDRELLLSYSAGLIDGEGCIGMYHNCHNNNYQLRVTVEMVDKSGLLLLEKLFGGRWYYKKAKTPRRARHTWMVFNSEASKMLKELEPYLIIKQEHAQIALQADWTSFKGKTMNQEQQDIRKIINDKIKKLNERGYYPKEGDSRNEEKR